MKSMLRISLILCATFALLTLSGCGGGGLDGIQHAGVISPAVSSAPPTAVSTSPAATAGNSYSLTEDTYGMQNATFMSASKSDVSLVLRAAIASSITDPNFTTVFRIDILQPGLISGPASYVIGGNAANALKFPGEILFFNGHKSTLLNTTSGTITFTSYGMNAGELIAGNFSVQVEDQNSAGFPRPAYTVKGNFRYVVDTSGALVPASAPVPVAAAGCYETKCASCHALGSYDPTSGGAPDLALKGGELSSRFSAGMPGHGDMTLSAEELHDLKIFLNAK